MELGDDNVPRIYTIRKSQHLGYGFILGSGKPSIVKCVVPNGPSYGLLKNYDVILEINGIDVEHMPQDQITKMVMLSDHEIEITVRRATYEEQIRATNRFYTFNDQKQDQISRSDSLTSNNLRQQQSLSRSQMIDQAMNDSPLNRLVTSIAHQHLQQPFQHNQSALSNNNLSNLGRPVNHQNYLTLQHDRTKNVLKQKANVDNTHIIANGTVTLSRNGHNKFGRHSPLPQRCKSSIEDANQRTKSGRKTSENGKDQSPLRRCNTMRPVRLPAKVMEIFKVVIKIFFEDGHEKLMSYNQDTTVGSILETLNARFGNDSQYSNQIKSYFGLAVTVEPDENSDEQQSIATKTPLHILDEDHPIIGIRKLPYASKLRILYRMIYPPTNINELYNQNKIAFEYLYKQSCNDLRLERFSPPLDAEAAMKLAALYLVEYIYSNHPKAHSNSKEPNVYTKLVEKDHEIGLRYFVPRSMIKATEDKKGKRVKRHYERLKTKMHDQLKKNFEEFDFEPPRVKTTTNINQYTTTSFHELALPELKCSPSDYIKIVFLNYLKELPCYRVARREKSTRNSISPMDHGSAGDCSSSIESVPRTSDSSPLIRQPRNQNGHLVANERMDQPNINMVTRMAQMNSMRSLSSLQPSSNETNGTLNGSNSSNRHIFERPEIAQTPSSISSITFNMQSSPSPQQNSFPPQRIQQNEPVSYAQAQVNMIDQPEMSEPSPMPRQNTQSRQIQKTSKYSSIDRSIADLLQSAVVPPPPPLSGSLYHQALDLRRDHLPQRAYLTPIITDEELRGLLVPAPPKSS